MTTIEKEAKRYKILRIDFEFFKNLLSEGTHAIRWDENGMPDDATLVNIRHGYPNCVELIIESSEFEYVRGGDVIPQLWIRGVNLHPDEHGHYPTEMVGQNHTPLSYNSYETYNE